MMKFVLYALFLLCGSQIAHGALPQPIKALYIDWQAINWASPELTVLESFNSGWNVIILSFYLSNQGPLDMAKAWQGVPSVSKQAVMNAVHAQGGVVLVSLGGATDLTPYLYNPTTLGTQIANWALSNYLDGVDFDIENLQQGFKWNSTWTTAQTVQWLADLTNAARAVLGPSGIISHAPQSPYFGPVGATNTWAGTSGGYVSVYQKASSIDFFSVQFYNQANGCYLDYQGLFQTSCSQLPSTSVNEIAMAGIPLSKIVVGKYINVSDASSGWIAPNLLNQYVNQAAQNLNWNTGVMAWAWGSPQECASWIETVYPISCLV